MNKLTDTEIDRIMSYVAEQDRRDKLPVGRMRYMISYWMRRAESGEAVAIMARSHVGALIREIQRLRKAIEEATRQGTAEQVLVNWVQSSVSDQTGSGPPGEVYSALEFISRFRTSAREAIAEPDPGQPDIVCFAGDDGRDTFAHEFDGGSRRVEGLEE